MPHLEHREVAGSQVTGQQVARAYDGREPLDVAAHETDPSQPGAGGDGVAGQQVLAGIERGLQPVGIGDGEQRKHGETLAEHSADPRYLRGGA